MPAMALTESERAWAARLVKAAASGEVLDLATGVPDRGIRPAEAATWPPERCVPANALRAAVLDPDLRPDPTGMRIRGARITGALVLQHASIPCSLALSYCVAECGLQILYSALPHLSHEHHLPPALVIDWS